MQIITGLDLSPVCDGIVRGSRNVLPIQTRQQARVDIRYVVLVSETPQLSAVNSLPPVLAWLPRIEGQSFRQGLAALSCRFPPASARLVAKGLTFQGLLLACRCAGCKFFGIGVPGSGLGSNMHV